ncbi:MAG: TIGR01458 family HAD-type hydrolase [Halieaceae bacterium]|nr:TIGR01458 family HAD-type hydrolase [Halieaceae bacterium]
MENSAYRAVFFDISGVLYQGGELIAGAPEAVSTVRDAGLAVRFLTNTSRKTCAQIRADLAAFGIETAEGEVITAPSAAHDYLRDHGLRPWCLVHPNIASEFADLDQDYPNAVVLGDAADGLNYDNLNRAFRLCHGGATLLGIGANRFFREGDTLLLDAGPFIKAIEYAASVEAVILGKPSAVFFRQGLEDVGCSPGEVLMVGDDVFGDVEGAMKVGLAGCLVRSGKYQPGDEDRVAGEFACIESVADLESVL